MKISKNKVCVEILSQDHAKEASELLEKYNEKIDRKIFPITFKTNGIPNNYLQFFKGEQDWGVTVISPFEKREKITLFDLEQILIDSNAK